MSWWKTATLYQVYVRSFQDSTGDGVGDLDGVTQRLAQLVDLGVDGIWLSPIHPSPDADFGYDVADYDAVSRKFGGMEAFERMMGAAKALGLRVVLDGVFAHTSSQHAWFEDARSSQTAEHRSFYHWHCGPRPPNNWGSTFGGPAWTRDPVCGDWYLHSFAPEQPDLNWAEPRVAEAVLGSMGRWFERGVDGFRLDVFNNYVKSPGLPDNPWRTDALGQLARLVYPFAAVDHVHDRDRPELSDVLARMRGLADAHGDTLLLGETLDERLRYRQAARWCGKDALHTAFHFQWLHSPWSAEAFHGAIWSQLGDFGGELSAAWALGNHDFTRMATRWGDGARTDDRMALVPLMQLTLPGLSVLYQGDELGLRERRLPRRQIQDPPGRRFWPVYRGRDGCRTPMAWEDSAHGGFSTHTPWLPLHEDAHTRNVAVQRAQAGSLWRTWQTLLTIRREHAALQTSVVELPMSPRQDVLTWLRPTGQGGLRMVANLGRRARRLRLPVGESVVGRVWSRGAVGVASGGVDLAPLSGALLTVEQSRRVLG